MCAIPMEEATRQEEHDGFCVNVKVHILSFAL